MLLTTGVTVIVVVDIQGGGDDPASGAADGGQGRHEIPLMGGQDERTARVAALLHAARDRGVPVVFIQEVHKPSLRDIGREMDGAEGVHCVEGWLETEIARSLAPRPEEYVVRKRRYSAFFGTELEIVLKGYRAQTLLLVGGLTDVCVHYTAADAHQHDYRVRVLTDCVGGSSQRAHEASLAAIEYLQRDALVTSADVHAWLADLPREALPEPAPGEVVSV